MIYKTFHGLQLSALGMGTMRLPVLDGDDSRIDQKAVEEMTAYAMAQGVNYYDTAWGYHGGNSEASIREALRPYARDSYYLADKFPGYDLGNIDKVEAIFEEQLRRCGVDYFDFYLFHNVYEANVGPYLDEKHGILAYLLRQKEAGRIRHLGFSVHGSLPVMRRFLEAYSSHMEFCQLQLNYVDWILQWAKEKMELLAEYDMPVWVMEPLRGGKLARLAPEDQAVLAALRPDEAVPAWAFRFLQSLPAVTMILSGMSSLAQVQDNISTFAVERPLDKREMEALLGLAGQILGDMTLPCTACHYCLSHCPQGLDIPALLTIYNEHRYSGGGFLPTFVLRALPEDKRPAACLGCRSCEAVCPQQLKISEALADLVQRMQD